MATRKEFILKSLAGTAGIYLADLNIYGSSVFKGLQPSVEVEEELYKWVPADNGADPMWCKGSTCIVRIGNSVFATGLETLSDHVPLNNVRYMLFERDKKGWKKILTDPNRTREPSPLVAINNKHLLLSANISLAEPKIYSGPGRPEILLFNASDTSKHETILPEWDGKPKFTEHTYRSFASDGDRGEVIIFQNIGDSHSTWAFRDASGKWSSKGSLDWPWGADYEKPEPIRICYPNVQLKDRKVYFFGVSDIIEPNRTWREYKKQITGRDWDYDFRRLFMTWSDDITTGKFHPWMEVSSREATCGWIDPCDLWIAPDGAVHLLWNERAIDERLREKFFPDAKQSTALNYAIFRNGEVTGRKSLVLSEEGGSQETPGGGRFQVTPDNRLFVIYYLGGKDKNGQPVSENRILEMKDGLPSAPVKVPLKQPFNRFFTATVRAGSKPSETIDLLGTPAGVRGTIQYARVRIK